MYRIAVCLVLLLASAFAQTTLVGTWAETSPDNYGGFDFYCVDSTTLKITGSYSGIGWLNGTVTADMRNMTGMWYGISDSLNVSFIPKTANTGMNRISPVT
jgi:hypothetical protein